MMKLFALTAFIAFLYISCFTDTSAAWIILGGITALIISSIKYVK